MSCRYLSALATCVSARSLAASGNVSYGFSVSAARRSASCRLPPSSSGMRIARTRGNVLFSAIFLFSSSGTAPASAHAASAATRRDGFPPPIKRSTRSSFSKDVLSFLSTFPSVGFRNSLTATFSKTGTGSTSGLEAVVQPGRRVHVPARTVADAPLPRTAPSATSASNCDAVSASNALECFVTSTFPSTLVTSSSLASVSEIGEPSPSSVSAIRRDSDSKDASVPTLDAVVSSASANASAVMFTTPGWSNPRSTPPKSPPVLESPAEHCALGVRETLFRIFRISLNTRTPSRRVSELGDASSASRLFSRRGANAAEDAKVLYK